MTPKTLCYVAAGGAVGAVARYLVTWGSQGLGAGLLPVGTLVANLGGCLAIGFLAAALTGPAMLREELRLGLFVGLLGGFTTFSSFGYETFVLLQGRYWSEAVWNVLLSNGLGLLAVAAGFWLAGRLHPA